MKSFFTILLGLYIANPAFSARTLCSPYSTIPTSDNAYDGDPYAAVEWLFYSSYPWESRLDESFEDYEWTDPEGCPGYGITTNSAPEFVYSDNNYNFLFRAKGHEARHWKKYSGRCIQQAPDSNETAGTKVVNGGTYLDGEGTVCITIFPKNETVENAPPLDPWKIPKINNDNEKTCKPDLYTPNPVFLPTGAKFLVETDFDDKSPHPLSLKRYYLSDRPNFERLFGKWRHSFDENLEHYGPTSTGKEYILVHLAGEGASHFYKQNGQWVNSSGGGNGSLTLAGNQWIFTSKNGVRRNFEKTGRILRRIDINGWAYEYSYSTSGDLKKVKNNFGRSLNFEQDSSDYQKWNVSLDNQHVVSYLSDYGQLGRVDYPDGNSKSYVYTNSLEEVWDESGVKSASYSYDAAGRVKSTEFADGVNKYQISYPGKYASSAVVTDPLGKVRTYKFGGENSSNATASTAPGSMIRRYISSATLNSQGFPIEDYDFKGNRNTYSWDTNRGLVITTTEAKDSTAERSTKNEWHPQWRLPVTVAESGRTANYTYDNLGNLLSQTVTDTATGAAHVMSWTYYPSGLVATETVPNGAIANYQYDNAGNLTTATNALGHTETFTHDAAGRVLTYTSATSLAAAYSYDARGRLLTANRGGLLTTLTYRPSGQVATATLPYGYVMTYSYDAAHRLIGWNDNRGASGTYALDAMGNRLSEEVRNAQGQLAWKLARSINSLNRVASTQIGSSAAPTTYSYDANGDLSSVTQTLPGIQNTTTLTLDALRRIKSLQDANNTNAALTYNALNDVTQASDFKGVSTTYTRDALGNAPTEASPDISSKSATYDALGLLKQVTDAMGRATTITRDALGRPTQLQYADATSTVLRYDLPGGSYNVPGAPQASVGYLSEVQDPGVTTAFQLDLLGRLTRKTQTLMANGDPRALAYSYHPAGSAGAGLLNTITYASGKQLSHVYNSTGQLTALHWNDQPLVTGITWNPLGQPTGWQWPSFVSTLGTLQPLTEQRTYTDANQLASSKLLNLTWDAAGRISLIQQQHMLPGRAAAQQAKLSSAFSHDAVGRLTASAHSAPAGLTLPTGWSLADTIELSASGYAWDANGNRTQVHYSNALASGTSTLQRNYQMAAGTNRLQSYAQTLQRPGSAAQNSNVTFSYDAAGALVKKGDNHLHYGADGRIAKAGEYADAADARAVSYVYNALGQRVFKSDARGAGQPATLQTLYAEDGIGSTVLGQYANQRSANSAAPAGQSDSTEIIYLPTASGPMPIAAEINGRLYAIHTDHLNTPRRLTSQQGQVAWQWLISGFGEVRPTTGDRGYGQTVSGPSYAQAVKFDLRYPGQVFDEETGLSYNLHRYYDAETGRYIQADPIGLDGGWNRFGYVGGDPLSFFDPMGLCSCTNVLSQAEALNNDSRYATSQPSRPGPNTNKCNFFVDDVLESTGVAPRRNILGMPISAGTWADPKAVIPNFPVVSNPQPGDVVAVSHRYADASGHVAIVKVPGVSSIGAGATAGSHVTGWPWDPSTTPRGNPVYRRCTCQ